MKLAPERAPVCLEWLIADEERSELLKMGNKSERDCRGEADDWEGWWAREVYND